MLSFGYENRILENAFSHREGYLFHSGGFGKKIRLKTIDLNMLLAIKSIFLYIISGLFHIFMHKLSNLITTVFTHPLFHFYIKKEQFVSRRTKRSLIFPLYFRPSASLVNKRTQKREKKDSFSSLETK